VLREKPKTAQKTGERVNMVGRFIMDVLKKSNRQGHLGRSGDCQEKQSSEFKATASQDLIAELCRGQRDSRKEKSIAS
jgi:hypothetical protein